MYGNGTEEGEQDEERRDEGEQRRKLNSEQLAEVREHDWESCFVRQEAGY